MPRRCRPREGTGGTVGVEPRSRGFRAWRRGAAVRRNAAGRQTCLQDLRQPQRERGQCDRHAHVLHGHTRVQRGLSRSGPGDRSILLLHRVDRHVRKRPFVFTEQHAAAVRRAALPHRHLPRQRCLPAPVAHRKRWASGASHSCLDGPRPDASPTSGERSFRTWWTPFCRSAPRRARLRTARSFWKERGLPSWRTPRSPAATTRGRPGRGCGCSWRIRARLAYSQAFRRDRLHREIGFETWEDLLREWERDHVRWDANDLLAKLRTWQLGDIGANECYRGDFAKALGAIRARAILMPCTTDLCFPPQDSAIEVKHMPDAELRPYVSAWGHCAASPPPCGQRVHAIPRRMCVGAAGAVRQPFATHRDHAGAWGVARTRDPDTRSRSGTAVGQMGKGYAEPGTNHVKRDTERLAVGHPRRVEAAFQPDPVDHRLAGDRETARLSRRQGLASGRVYLNDPAAQSLDVVVVDLGMRGGNDGIRDGLIPES